MNFDRASAQRVKTSTGALPSEAAQQVLQNGIKIRQLLTPEQLQIVNNTFLSRVIVVTSRPTNGFTGAGSPHAAVTAATNALHEIVLHKTRGFTRIHAGSTATDHEEEGDNTDVYEGVSIIGIDVSDTVDADPEDDDNDDDDSDERFNYMKLAERYAAHCLEMAELTERDPDCTKTFSHWIPRRRFVSNDAYKMLDLLPEHIAERCDDLRLADVFIINGLPGADFIFCDVQGLDLNYAHPQAVVLKTYLGEWAKRIAELRRREIPAPLVDQDNMYCNSKPNILDEAFKNITGKTATIKSELELHERLRRVGTAHIIHRGEELVYEFEDKRKTGYWDIDLAASTCDFVQRPKAGTNEDPTPEPTASGNDDGAPEVVANDTAVTTNREATLWGFKPRVNTAWINEKVDWLRNSILTCVGNIMNVEPICATGIKRTRRIEQPFRVHDWLVDEATRALQEPINSIERNTNDVKELFEPIVNTSDLALGGRGLKVQNGPADPFFTAPVGKDAPSVASGANFTTSRSLFVDPFKGEHSMTDEMWYSMLLDAYDAGLTDGHNSSSVFIRDCCVDVTATNFSYDSATGADVMDSFPAMGAGSKTVMHYVYFAGQDAVKPPARFKVGRSFNSGISGQERLSFNVRFSAFSK